MEPFPTEMVALDELKPHPRNYRRHPDDEIIHLTESIRTHGFYRNIVIAQDGTILAGHGVALACQKLGRSFVPVFRLPIAPDDPRALKVLAGDNEIGHLAERDDRMLSELLREISETDMEGLLGTGFDEMMLANLVFVSRPAHEIADFNEAAEWVGMPDYEPGERPLQLIVTFPTEEDRERFAQSAGITIDKREKRTWTTRWPYLAKKDRSAVRFEAVP